MEFKIIFYVLVGIGYFVYNNYQKFVSENRKRTFNVPPPQQPVMEMQPVTKPKPVERKKIPVVVRSSQRQPFVKKELPKRRKEYVPVMESLEENFSAKLPAAFNAVSAAPQIQKKPKQKIQLRTLRNAILYGEIINQPAWTKY